VALPLAPERARARWWVHDWEIRHQLEAESMRRDDSIERVTPRAMRRMPDLLAYAGRHRLMPWDLLAYGALASGPYGRYRLVAVFRTHPDDRHPAMLCLDGPRESEHRNPPFEDGVWGKSAELCLYYSGDHRERRWSREHGLIRLFDIGRRHLINEYEWRRRGRKPTDWPGEAAPHGTPPPAPSESSLLLPPLSPLPEAVFARTPSTPRRAAA
jgi:hypothetical protein